MQSATPVVAGDSRRDSYRPELVPVRLPRTPIRLDPLGHVVGIHKKLSDEMANECEARESACTLGADIRLPKTVCAARIGNRTASDSRQHRRLRQISKGAQGRNVPDQRPGAADHRLSTGAPLPGSLHLVCVRQERAHFGKTACHFANVMVSIRFFPNVLYIMSFTPGQSLSLTGVRSVCSFPRPRRQEIRTR